MNFFNNKEIRVFIKQIAVLSVILISTGFFIGRQAGILIVISVALLSIAFFVFTHYRYRQIRRLSEYLRRICNGEHSLDIRDNYEGELSILKSEIYKVTEMLSEYNEKLSQEKVILADHIADISHQLKTPLTSMTVMVDLLADENLNKNKRNEFISHIQAQLERTEWLISSLLKISKLDAGVVEMHKKRVPIKELIDKTLKTLFISMELKNIKVTMNSPENLFIYCDLNWTSEALTNIVKNCIEHTQKGGGIHISADDNPLYTEVKIRDNGIGISKKDLPHIFTRFYKGENSSPDSVGIGLAMSKSIICNQGGDIMVKSQLGRGSSFFVRLYKTVV